MRGLMVLGAVLVVLWLAGVIFFKIVGFAIHLLLIAGVILLILAVVRRGGDAVRRRL